ncbi:hypothetical protein HY384_04250 [Candidatus Daviesbacteria bacterium]|nr:hypothetical protein [Candidatus Daviesbacteria bacterium]
MYILTSASAFKLQKILSKRLGRELDEEELNQAHEALMGFAEALMDLEPSENKPITNNHTIKKSKQSIENNKYVTV